MRVRGALLPAVLTVALAVVLAGCVDGAETGAPYTGAEATVERDPSPGAGTAAAAPARPPLRVGIALGDDDALVTVVEFSDPGCWSCSTFAYETFPELRRDYIDTGRVQWRTVLIDRGFPNGVPAANALRCAAAQDGFWSMRAEVARRQREWITQRNAAPLYAVYAQERGMDGPALLTCMDESAAHAAMSTEEMVALQLNVRAVPMFLVGSQRVLGALRPADFRRILDQELARAEAR
jgi:protein-disulfide isomerase